ncbi:sigma-54-dependent Fis family transcriptional regulator [Candidatus Calescamantes bacterium]|nr:sigma-54-dependent Fis family transcriptional regulator [Candidatus Calescamantes bacterium]
MKEEILLIEDDTRAREGLKIALEEEGYSVIEASTGEEGLKWIKRKHIPLLITDLKLPGINGMEVLKKTLKISPSTEVIILTAYGTVENAVEAMKEGAYHYLTKPINLDEFLIVVKKALDHYRLKEKVELLEKELEERYSFENIIGTSRKMREVFQTITQVAPTKAPVLITGESGTGKELVARAIHRRSDRKDKPFVVIHCGAIVTTLLESELFGHEKGAFTGAIESKPGRFELADGGTIFLDEVSEIEPSVQVKLLRVLQEQEFERVGGVKTIKVDVRILSATNVNLEERVKEGKFREDLYYRLKVITIHLPPLRERKEDIPLLVHAFIKEASEANRKEIKGITSRALTILMNYHWPGNVRELKNVIESMVILAKKDVLTVNDIPPYIRCPGEKEDYVTIKLGTPWHEIEKELIFAALRKSGGNKSKAAEILGLSRRTLYRKLRELKGENK